MPPFQVISSMRREGRGLIFLESKAHITLTFNPLNVGQPCLSWASFAVSSTAYLANWDCVDIFLSLSRLPHPTMPHPFPTAKVPAEKVSILPIPCITPASPPPVWSAAFFLTSTCSGSPRLLGLGRCLFGGAHQVLLAQSLS